MELCPGASFFPPFFSYWTCFIHIVFSFLFVLSITNTINLILLFFTAWLGSIGISITLFLSPIISTICQRKSARIYAVIGGLICALGCLFLAFSNQIEQVFISHCVVLSPGSGITLNTANIIIGRYFRKKRELAEMIMLSGTGLGAALLAVLFRELYWWVTRKDQP